MSKLDKITELLYLDQNHSDFTTCLNPPLFRSSTLVFKSQEEFEAANKPYHTDKTYGRAGTETVKNFEAVMAHLDKAHGTIAVSSGMNAIALALMGVLQAGDHLLITDASYRCSRRFVEEQIVRYGIEFDYFPPEPTAEDLEKLVKPNTKAIFVETPTSGSYEFPDIDTLVKFAKKHNLVSIVDNSWATSLLFTPLELGFDIAVQSCTKYLSGNSDMFLGVVSCNERTYNEMYQAFLNFATIPAPEYCNLALRSMKSLDLRIAKHEESSVKVAKWLVKHPKVAEVMHPLLHDSRAHTTWKKYFNRANGTFCFYLDKKFTWKDAARLINNLQIVKIGLSWGGFESLINLFDLRERLDAKIYPNNFSVRLHVGLENPDDLIDDLNNALNNL